MNKDYELNGMKIVLKEGNDIYESDTVQRFLDKAIFPYVEESQNIPDVIEAVSYLLGTTEFINTLLSNLQFDIETSQKLEQIDKLIKEL